MTNIERPAWLASLPPHWGVERGKTMTTLIHRPVSEGDGIVTAFRDGRVMLRANRRTDGFTEAVQEIGYQGVRSGELVIHSMDGFAGAIGVSESDGKMSPVVHIYQTPRGNPYYIAYALRVAAHSGFIQSLTKGIRERSTSFDKASFRSMLLPRPPRSEQDGIVDYIDRETSQIDELITEQQRLIEMLVERRSVVSEVAINSTTSIDKGQRLKHLVTGVTQGWSPQCYPWPADGVESWAVLKAGSVNGGIFRPCENKALPEDQNPRPDRVVQQGQLVVSRANTRELVGSAAVVEENFPRLMLSDKLYAFNFDKEKVHPAYVAIALGTPRLRGLIELEATGSSPSMQNISQDDILNLPMDLPTPEVQRQVISYVREQTAQIDTLISESERLIELSQERRSALITAAVTGQIDIPQEA